MANRDTPMGFTPAGMLDGSEVPVRQYPLTSAHLRVGIGDLIEVLNTGLVDVDNDPGTNPEKLLGAVTAVYDSNYNPAGSPNSSTATKYLAASAGGYVDVALMVGNAMFKVQSSGSAASTDRFASGDGVGGTACNTVTGRSAMEFSGTQSTGAANFLVIDKVDEPGNAWGTNVELLVIACEGYFVGTTAQVRVGI